MAHTSKIEWTEATWNPWHGCHKVSQGCKNCYMFRDKERFGQDPNVVVRSKTKFYDPLKWKETRTIFTCSWSDFFIEGADAWRDEAFAIMALTPQHTYQVLTKRPDRMRDYMNDPETRMRIADAMISITCGRKWDGNWKAWTGFINDDEERPNHVAVWPLPHIWLGVSVEDQMTAKERIPILLQTPAAVRWLSVEPLLGPVDVGVHLSRNGLFRQIDPNFVDPMPGADWCVVGGESGPDARPMHPDWARSIRDQCQAANVPFFFKQWGEWGDAGHLEDVGNSKRMHSWRDGNFAFPVGKTKAGRLLDGREWNEMPEVSR